MERPLLPFKIIEKTKVSARMFLWDFEYYLLMDDLMEAAEFPELDDIPQRQVTLKEHS